ncbi:MAG: hypothetical protein NTZ24_04980 [Deltaproteobacteria bacterium]|nr:hypothetical protein [Deltaproteobacteria bacterium]
MSKRHFGLWLITAGIAVLNLLAPADICAVKEGRKMIKLPKPSLSEL